MPFIPYTNEEIKKNVHGFTPFSDEELTAIRTEKEQLAQNWMDEVNSLYQKMQNGYSKGQDRFQTLNDYRQYTNTLSGDVDKLLKNYSYAEQYVNRIEDQNQKNEYLKGVQKIKEQLDLISNQLQDKEQAKIIEEYYADQERKKEFEKKSGLDKTLQALGDNLTLGLSQWSKGLVKAVDEFLPDEMIMGGDNPITKGIDWMQETADKGDEEIQKRNAAMSEGWQLFGKFAQGIGSALPGAAMALMSGGASVPGQVATLGAPATTSQMVSGGLSNLAKDPNFWMSAIPTFGGTYSDAMEDGATEAEAAVTAILNGFAGSLIEVGGGIQQIPKGQHSIREWLKSAVEEGGEEVVQSAVENFLKKQMYNHDIPLFSTTDDEAVINPKRAAEEFALGTAVGGLFGGAKVGADAIANAVGNSSINNSVGNNENRTYDNGKIRIPSQGEEIVSLLTPVDNSTVQMSEKPETYTLSTPDLSEQAKGSRGRITAETGAAVDIDPDVVETAARIAEQTGRNIQFVETLGNGIEGKYDAATGTLTIAADSPSPLKAILKHELTHSLEGTRAYTELSDFVMAEFVQKDAETNGMSVDEFIQAKMTQYAESGETLTREGAVKELVADYCAAKLFADEKAIRQLSAEKPSVARRIWAWLRSVKTKLLGTKQEKLIAKAEALYRDALMGPMRKGNGTMYSIEAVPDGRQYVKADREVIHGENPDEWRKQVQNYINNSIRNGKDVVVYGADGDALTITKDTAGKARFRNSIALPDGSHRRMTDSEFATKLRAETHIDELAQASTRGKYDVPDSKNHPFAKDGFNYRTAYFLDNDGSYYRITLSVGKNGEVNTVYNVGKIKEAKFPFVAQRPPIKNNGKGGLASNTTVPQSTDSVNTSIPIGGENSTQSAIGFLGEDTAAAMKRLVEQYGRNSSNPVEIGRLTPMDADTTPAVSGGSRDTGTGYTVPTESAEEGDAASHFSKSIEKASIFDDDFKKLSLEDVGISTYDSITNKETLRAANKALNDGGYRAVTEWFSKSADEATPEDIAAGIILLSRYQKAGDYEGMTNVARRLRKFGTSAGQTVQEFSILGRLTPEGMAYYAQKSLDEAFEAMVKSRSQNWINKNADRFRLNDDDVGFILDKTQQASKLPEGRDKNILLGEIAARIQNKLPPEKGQNIRALARISMLLNPKTNVRNILGNVSITPISWIDDIIGTAIDKGVALKTGKRTTGLFDLKSVKGLGKGVYESFDDFRRHINTRDIDADRFEIGRGGKSFNEYHTGKAQLLNPLSKALNALDRTTSFLLEAGDRGFFEMWFMNSLNNQMRLNDVQTPTPEMIDVARQDALARTWQDTNGYTKFVSGIKKAFNSVNVGGYGLGDIFIKFTKTPANLTKALVDYSPAGVVKAIASDGKRFYQAVTRGQATPKLQRAFVNSLSKGITGTLLMILFAALADREILKGKGDADKDVAEFEKNILGIQPYSVKIGDQSYSYEWMQPIGGSAAIVADIVQQMKGQKPTQYFKGGSEEEAAANAILSAIQSGGQVLYDQSFMQSLANLFESDSLVQGLIDGVFSEPSVFVPQIISQTSQLFDDTARRSYVSGRPLDTAQNKVLSKTPLRTQLEPVVDVLGREVATNNSVWNVYFNPANTYGADSTLAADEMYRVYQATGDNRAIPPKAPNSISITVDGEKQNISLTAEQKTIYQKTTGSIASNEVERLLSKSQYRKLSEADKVDLLADIYAYANAVAKSEVSDYTLTGRNAKINDAEKGGVSVADYLLLSIFKDEDGNGSVSQDEMKNVLNQTELTDSQKATLWELQNKSWKNNPYR